jgi:hypothetical protein
MKGRYKREWKRRKPTWKPTPFPERNLAQLQEAGLFVTGFPGKHVILKPTTVPGNSLPHLDGFWYDHDGEVPPTDAPATWVVHEGSYWSVVENDIVVWGPDSTRTYQSPADVVTDLLDYYFGDPGRMQEWARQRTPEARIAANEAFLGKDLAKAGVCRFLGCEERRVRWTAFCPHHFRLMMDGEL